MVDTGTPDTDAVVVVGVANMHGHGGGELSSRGLEYEYNDAR
jgi:hypothetical protein